VKRKLIKKKIPNVSEVGVRKLVSKAFGPKQVKKKDRKDGY